MKKLSKLIVILGPTASGKTSLAIELAKKCNGEIISADSRQVYRYMKIGTDVPGGKWKDDKYIVQDIPHYLMNCIEPDQEFTLADFKVQAVEAANDIISRGKLPFLVGGTGLYLSSVVDNLDIPKAKPNKKLRAELEAASKEDLVAELKQIDPASAKVIDLNNPRRLVRALEVVKTTGKSFLEQKTKSDPLFKVLQIGIKRDRKITYERINKRVDEQIKEGLIEEVKEMVNKGYGWDLPSMSGLGYRQFKDYLAGKQNLKEAIEILKRDIRHYAKKQITWFKRDATIQWIEHGEFQKADSLIDGFLNID